MTITHRPSIVSEDFQRAIEDLKDAQDMYQLCSEDFEVVAWHTLKLCEARVDALRKIIMEEI